MSAGFQYVQATIMMNKIARYSERNGCYWHRKNKRFPIAMKQNNRELQKHTHKFHAF
jgi:uncharacterized FlgJ-related protein